MADNFQHSAMVMDASLFVLGKKENTYGENG